MAGALQAHWTVLYIETSPPSHEQERLRVSRILEIARQQGADVITATNENPLAAALRVIAQRNVTQVFVEKTVEPASWRRWQKDRLVSELLRKDNGLAIHVVPAAGMKPGPRHVMDARTRRSKLAQYLTALGVIAVMTLAAFLFTPVVGAHSTALIYLLTIAVLALFVERGPTLAAAALSALLWEFFFLPPYFALLIRDFEDTILFAMYFIVALVLGHLTTRIRAQEEAERRREARATALYLLTRDLNEAADLEQIVRRVVRQIESSFHSKVAVLLPQADDCLRLCPGSTFLVPVGEQNVPQWVFEHRDRAGNMTRNSSSASALYLPLATSGACVGVLGLKLNEQTGLNLHQESLLEAFLHQIAMTLDRHRLNEISEKAKLLAESERLSKTLLDSMSHEIRTPIAAIKSATGNLAELRDGDARLREDMIAEIQEATERLNRLVGNVLEATRLESGALRPRTNECDVGELIHGVLEQMEKELSAHEVTVRIQPALPVVQMDFVMMQQALSNLLSNSALHTPTGTAIEVGAKLNQGALLLTVADRGPGIPADSLARIFDKFYRVPNSRTGGTGLGLSLVKGFVEAQGGRVNVQNRQGGGVAFTIQLPCQNVSAVPEAPKV
jgi:two-component system sensor histidine kinase KdpD